jgi:hypothetical protein
MTTSIYSYPINATTMSQDLLVVDSLARSSSTCWCAFETFSSALRQFSDIENLSFSSQDADDAFEQFRVLVRNAGAYAEGKSSLDYRLQDSAPTKRAVLVILEDLSSNLIHCKNDKVTAFLPGVTHLLTCISRRRCHDWKASSRLALVGFR